MESHEWESLHFLSAKEENKKVNSKLKKSIFFTCLKQCPEHLKKKKDENILNKTEVCR